MPAMGANIAPEQVYISNNTTDTSPSPGAFLAVCKNRDDLLDQNKAIMAKCRELDRQNQTLQINFNRKNDEYNNKYARVVEQESMIEFLLCEVELLTRRLAEKHAQIERLTLNSKDFDEDSDDDIGEM